MSKTANELYNKELRLPTKDFKKCSCRYRRNGCMCWARAFSWNLRISQILARRMQNLNPKDTVTPKLLKEWYEQVGDSIFANRFRDIIKPYMEKVK